MVLVVEYMRSESAFAIGIGQRKSRSPLLAAEMRQHALLTTLGNGAIENLRNPIQPYLTATTAFSWQAISPKTWPGVDECYRDLSTRSRHLTEM